MTLLHIKYTSCHGVAEKKIFFMHFHYKSMVDNDMPEAWPVWTPGAPLPGFIKRNTIHSSTQNMKALGHVVSEKKIFYVFPIVSLWELLTPWGGAILTPRHDSQDLCKAPNNNAAYQILVVSEKKIFTCVFHSKTMANDDSPEVGLYGSQGHGWQDL